MSANGYKKQTNSDSSTAVPNFTPTLKHRNGRQSQFKSAWRRTLDGVDEHNSLEKSDIRELSKAAPSVANSRNTDDAAVRELDETSPNLFRGKGASVGSKTEDHTDQFSYSGYDSPARTTFDPQEVDSTGRDPQKWTRLSQWQRGNRPNWDGHEMEDRQSTADKFHSIDKKRVCHALACAADLNTGEKEVVIYNSTRLSYQDFGQHRGVERVALGLIAVVAETRRSDIEKGLLHLQDNFKDLMEKFGIDYQELKTIKKEIRNQIDRPYLNW